MSFLLGIGAGLIVALIAGVILQRKYKNKLNAILNLDWDMDGKSNEIYEKIKKLLNK